jgi:hypothetical protein
MPHVQIDREWTVAAPPDVVRDRIVTELKAGSIAVVSPPGTLPLAFKGGSGCLTRLIGGWFVGPSTLPKKGTINLVASGDGTQVTVHVEDALGFGLVDPMFAKRFEESFEGVIARIKRASS